MECQKTNVIPSMRFPLAMLSFKGMFLDYILHSCRSGSGEPGKARGVSSEGDPSPGLDSLRLAHSTSLYLLFTAK